MMNRGGELRFLLHWKRTSRFAAAGIIGLGLPLPRLLEQQPDSTQAFRDSVAVMQAAIADGRKVFHGVGTCFACHGAKLEGTAIAPTLRAHKWRNGDGSLTMILRVLHNGVPNTAMVSHPGNIKENELLQVASYVWAVGRGAVKP